MCLCARGHACPQPAARAGQCLGLKGIRDTLPVGIFHYPHSPWCLVCCCGPNCVPQTHMLKL